MTSGGPSPNHESPDSEFSGLERSTHDLTKMPSSISPPRNGPTPMSRNVFTELRNSSRR